MLSFNDYLVEARKNPGQNIKVGGVLDQLKIIANDNPDAFVRFSGLPKLGANPSSKFDTPLGICAYPIGYVIDRELKVPYAGDYRYVMVFNVKESARIWDLSSEVDFMVDDVIKALTDVTHLGLLPSKFANVRELWIYIRAQVKRSYWTSGLTPFDYLESHPGAVGIRMRVVLTQMGLDGVIDPGHGIIHENEPTQGLFFNVGVLKLLDIIDTKHYQMAKSSKELIDWYIDILEGADTDITMLQFFGTYVIGKRLYQTVAKLGNEMMQRHYMNHHHISEMITRSEAIKLSKYGFDIATYTDIIDSVEGAQ